MLFKFVIGRPDDSDVIGQLFKELKEFDDLILFDVEDAYKKLPFKVIFYLLFLLKGHWRLALQEICRVGFWVILNDFASSA